MNSWHIVGTDKHHNLVLANKVRWPLTEWAQGGGGGGVKKNGPNLFLLEVVFGLVPGPGSRVVGVCLLRCPPRHLARWLDA
jgi:hypothetical protein